MAADTLLSVLPHVCHHQKRNGCSTSFSTPFGRLDIIKNEWKVLFDVLDDASYFVITYGHTIIKYTFQQTCSFTQTEHVTIMGYDEENRCI